MNTSWSDVCHSYNGLLCNACVKLCPPPVYLFTIIYCLISYTSIASASQRICANLVLSGELQTGLTCDVCQVEILGHKKY